MTDNPKSHPQGNAEKNPEDWVTGDEKMTARRRAISRRCPRRPVRRSTTG
ncbi:DUF3072 domain-containing protein [Limimaricola cinnabarinus]|uniref:Uncharacterized protein n=1 Tax=Limimaricola cinnabarinus LL-001 TaxID=1337093 RepID=U3AHU1_9RHOB|nr:DUF3072 domain-containing protein [Limimaricola cinnabarinus]GAD54348.1 hypothetical protein MBELCI_0400 [Limimaricola cinnabarinus LL-001]